MLVLLFIVHLLSARALPAQVPAVVEANTSPTCKDIDNCRTLLGIIWSCLTTIFLCTWVSIHPNVPEPVDTRRMSLLDKCTHKLSSFFRDKVVLFMCALLVPEYVLAWAIRQYLQANYIIRTFPDLELTQTHAFFIIMGGFHYCEGSDKAGESYKPVHPLTYTNVTTMLREKTIMFPTEQELQNQSKSDWLAKSIVLLQTLWFVTQCIARRVENIPTTELEIVTLAYTTINVGIFIAWWNKPRNIDCPIRVFQSPEESDPSDEKGPWWEEMIQFIAGGQDDIVDLHKGGKVPMFYAGKVADREAYIADGITLLVGMVFGAIHCVAWSFEFPSHTQAFLWRLSSVAITAVPVILLVTGFGSILVDDRSRAIQLPIFILLYCMPLFGLLYVAARLAILVLAFLSLSSLPPGVFQAVQWTTRIPHL